MVNDGETNFEDYTPTFNDGFQTACKEMIFVLNSKDPKQEMETRLIFMGEENAEIFKKLFYKI
jgi:hypothetical protein